MRISASGSTRLRHIITFELASGSVGGIFFNANGTLEYPKELVEYVHV